MNAPLSMSHRTSPAQPSPMMLELDAVSKKFGGLQVFDNISFKLGAGEVLGVIGPNGAGKTTLINCISGTLKPSSGQIRLAGQSITDMPLYRVSALGVVRSFQQTSTFKGATVEENLYRAQKFGADGVRGEVDLTPLLQEFGLMAHRNDQSDTLPYGLQKMLGLLMVLAIRPKFLLLDEPAAGLERRERGQIDTFVDFALRQMGCGVLIVEHDMDLVKRLCPQILVLEAGRLLASGPPEIVLQRQDVRDAYLGSSGE